MAACGLGAVWLFAVYGQLALPWRTLSTRDIPAFHLPLRQAFRSLAQDGFPQWNPALHGGQPILSNPSYTAFYPLTWLSFAVEPTYGLGLSVLLHAAIAFAGAWWLARRLGSSPSGAALAAVGYSGAGSLVSMLNAFTLFSGLAWWPWIMAAVDAMLEAPRARWARYGIGAGLALAALLLNGEPSTVIMAGLGVCALAVRRGVLKPGALPRLLLPAALAVGLSAVQLVPAFVRLADGSRAGGLGAAEAAEWSLPAARLAELALPRLFGDPARHARGLYFGWGISDRSFPYVTSLYPGLLLTVLAVCALLRWPIARRGVWAALCVVGLLLALGRHNPLYEPIRAAVPFLSVIRYPEKFVALTTLAMTVAACLGWSWLLSQRAAGRRDRVNFPLALAAAWLAVCLALTVSLYAAPQAALWHIRTHGVPGLSAPIQAAGLDLLRREGLAATLVAAGVTALFALCRWGHSPQRALSMLAVALVAGDLWRVGHGLVETAPAETYARPPGVLRPELLKSRMWVPRPPDDQPQYIFVTGEQSVAEVRSQIEHLTPYTGLLWGVEYGFNVDFDLTLTGPARRAAELLAREKRPAEVHRLLGAWNVGNAVVQKPIRRLRREMAGNREASPVEAFTNTLLLPRFRLVGQATLYPDVGAAERASARQGFALGESDHWVCAGAAQGVLRSSPGRQLLSAAERGSRVLLTYQADGEALLVAAITYDRGWRARVDDAEVPVCQTGIGQLGVEVPAGRRSVELRYREPYLLPAAAVSGLSLLGCAVLLLASSRTAVPGDRSADAAEAP